MGLVKVEGVPLLSGGPHGRDGGGLAGLEPRGKSRLAVRRRGGLIPSPESTIDAIFTSDNEYEVCHFINET